MINNQLRRATPMFKKTLLVLSTVLTASVAHSNYVGSEIQYFNPTPENMDFFTVHSSRTLPVGTFKTTLFFDYAENIHYSNIMNNNVAQAQLGFGVGVTERFSFGITGSGILNYDDQEGGEYTTDSFTHVRTSFKYRFCDCEAVGFALIGNLGFGLMDPDYFVGNDNDLSASLTVAYDRMISERVRFGANLGYRYRNSDNLMPAAPGSYAAITATPRDGSDILASVAMNVALNQNLTGVTELYMSLPTDEFFDFTTDSNTFEQKGAEVLIGANYSLNDKTDLAFGGTLGVFSEAANADWRAFVGIGYFFGGQAEDAAFNALGRSSAPAPKPVKVAKEEKVEEKKVVPVEDAPVLQEFNITAKFPSGSATLTSEAKAQLAPAGNFIKSTKVIRAIFVEGHSDSQGPAEFNKKLSERRAQAVKNYLTRAYSIDAEKVKAVGYGESSPIADNSTVQGRAKNRRVIIKIK